MVIFVIVVLDEFADDRRAPLVTFHRQAFLLGRQGTDDQRRAGLVDQNAVGLVDQGEVGIALDRVFIGHGGALAQHAAQQIALPFADPPQQQPVTEKIEAELLRRAVSDVAGVGLAPLRLRHLRLHHAHAHPQGFVNRPHPFGVAAGQIVVDRRQVASLAQQAVQVQRQRSRERLSFARLHLDNRAMEHGDAAEHLNVEVPHVDGPPSGLADQGIAFDQQPRQRLSALGTVAQRKTPFAELLVAEPLQLRLQAGDLRQQRRPTHQPPAIQAAVESRQMRPNDVGKLAHGALAGFFGKSTMSTERSEVSSFARG